MPSNLSFLDIINIGDNAHLNRHLRPQVVSPFDDERLIPFRLSSGPDSPIIGILRPVIVDKIQSEIERAAKNGLSPIFEVKDSGISFSDALNTPLSRTATMAELCMRWRDTGMFPDIIGPKKWRNELFAVFADPLGPHDYNQDGSGNFVFEMERSACPLFGIVLFGVHMSFYEGSGDDLKIWVPRRALTKIRSFDFFPFISLSNFPLVGLAT
jgi:hypothetical protein